MRKHAGGQSAGMATSMHSCMEQTGYSLHLEGWETMVRSNDGAAGKSEVTVHAY
ncbi:hypothetical protein [Bacillus sp. FJAT-28004]|uniref:hypothetical protein n=1 Tax=Bacillus sp. FJAT-28004 TaxID=1679165 RepID=UPI000A6FEC17|nr:hypothetical protein [Bacillus sp. FJAT-28004]